MKTHLKGITLTVIDSAKQAGKTAYFVDGGGKSGMIIKTGSQWRLVSNCLDTVRATRRQVIAKFAHYHDLPIEVI